MNAPLPQRGEFEMVVGDRTIKLKFSYSSMARMEQRLGYSLTKMSTEVAQMNIKLNAIVAVVYEAALAAGEKKVTEESLGDLFVANGYTTVARKVMECVLKMMTSGKEEVPASSGNGAEEETLKA